MKKLLVLFLVLTFVLALPFAAVASEINDSSDEFTAPTDENAAESEIPSDTVTADVLPEAETDNDGKNSPSPTFSEKIVSFITENYTESALVSFIITGIIGIVFSSKNNKGILGAIGVLNNNAVKVSEKSDASISKANNQINQAVLAIESFRSDMKKFLDFAQSITDENTELRSLVKTLNEALDRLKLADIELANEIAQLFNVSKLPTAVKDEFYARHKSALALIDGTKDVEVSANDGGEA